MKFLQRIFGPSTSRKIGRRPILPAWANPIRSSG